MSNYSYVAIDPQGAVMRGTLEVADQSEALRRIKEMGFFPTKVLAANEKKRRLAGPLSRPRSALARPALALPGFSRGIKPRLLAVFTRQLATLVEAGMPLLRSLRILEEQAEHSRVKRVIGELSFAIESGSSLGEALAMQPRVFSGLYISMVRAGEVAGALEVTLGRLAEFIEKGQKIKGKVKAAMVYPCAVLLVSGGVVTLLMTYVVPRFKAVFEGLVGSQAMPAFTMFIFNLSEAIQRRFPLILAAGAGLAAGLTFGLKTESGRQIFDRLKLTLPVLGPVFRKVAISRFTRTLGTLVSSGVPILQALSIVKETAGNKVISRLIGVVHENVKQGEPMAPTLKASSIFPAMVAGMVDVGEETGALPEMLMKVADNYDSEVDNAVGAITSLLEPVMILLLAVVVGSIVIAMFLPLIILLNGPPQGSGGSGDF
jgi:type IV pilus assembly protein PilC